MRRTLDRRPTDEQTINRQLRTVGTLKREFINILNRIINLILTVDVAVWVPNFFSEIFYDDDAGHCEINLRNLMRFVMANYLEKLLISRLSKFHKWSIQFWGWSRSKTFPLGTRSLRVVSTTGEGMANNFANCRFIKERKMWEVDDNVHK